jgi:hypothetical protein
VKVVTPSPSKKYPCFLAASLIALKNFTVAGSAFLVAILLQGVFKVLYFLFFLRIGLRVERKKNGAGWPFG